MAVVSITRLRVRSWRVLPIFFVQALRSGRQAAASDGNLRTTVLREAHRTFWTRTVWRDEQAAKAFMMAGVHRGVMRKLLEWCDEAALVRWEQPDATPPSWQESLERLRRDGRRSKVNHPSPAHIQYEIAEPVVRRTGELALR